MKKLFLSWMLLISILTGSLPVFAADLSVSTEETLIKGVTYRHIQRLAENGWQDIHVVQADLNEPHLQFDVLSHENGKSYLENTYSSAARADAIAAVNADFFQAVKESGRGNAIGLEISDGIMRTTPAAYEQMNALYQTKNSKELLFDMFSYNFDVMAPNLLSAPITVINKYDSMTGIVMYTRDFAETTPGSAANVLEMVVENGVVTAKNRDVGPVPIPKDGYVLACDVSLHTFLNDNLNVGDEVTLSISTTPNYETIETAVGGGGMLLVEGKIPETYSHTVSGTHPRSAVGVDKTGKIITLVAVDGRRSEAAGMTMKQLGALMAELGCYNAMNLDGGGSTLMAVKQNGNHQVVNQPSDGSKRAVTNSIGIMAKTKESVPTSMNLRSDSEAIFSGTSVWLQAQLYDQYGVYMHNVPSEEITWSLSSGKGSFRGDTFLPSAPGTAVIHAKAAGFSDEVTITVLDTPHSLAFNTNQYNMNVGDNQVLWMTARDAKGQAALVYPSDLEMTVTDPTVASVSGNAVTAHSYGSTLLTANFGDVTAYAVVTVGGATPVSAPKNESIADSQETSGSVTTDQGFQFTVFGNTRTPVKFFDLFIMNGVTNAVKSESNLNFFVGNDVDSSLLQDLGDNKKLANGYSRFTKNGSTFITLKNAYGTTLFGSDSTQWEKLRDEINTLSGGNLFVFLNDHNISSSAIEKTVFKNLMKEAAKKADNVYVFAGGYVNETVIEDGVRYITTAGVFPSIGVKPPATNISYLKYYLVTVNGSTVTYERKGIVK